MAISDDAVRVGHLRGIHGPGPPSPSDRSLGRAAAEVLRCLELGPSGVAGVVGVASVCGADALPHATELASILLTHTGQDVVLVEADFRGPSRFAVAFGIPAEPGLTHLAARPQRADWERNGSAHLYALPSGRSNTWPANGHVPERRGSGAEPETGVAFLGANALSAAIDGIRSRYTTAVVVVPPLDDQGDGYVVARLCDLLVLVVEQDHTSRVALAAAVERVGRHRIVGTVLVTRRRRGIGGLL